MRSTKVEQELQRSLSQLFLKRGKVWEDCLLADLPKKWEKHGDLILFSHTSFSNPAWKNLDQNEFWTCVAEVFKVKRIAKQHVICPDGVRTPTVVLVLGKETWVTHIDNKIRYSFDVTKCMFSSGNITEKIRMSKLKCKDEIVVDMFAGIGYFTIPLLVHGKAKFVHACEWNPNAVQALRCNLHDNKVADRCQIYEGDNREVCPKGVADRVLLGLIPTAKDSYHAACQAVNSETGGILHIHCNVTSSGITCNDISEADFSLYNYYNVSNISCNKQLRSEWLVWAKKTADDISAILEEQQCRTSNKWTIQLLHIERVKSYAPHIDHLVLDLQLNPFCSSE
ncbi:tRNA wybutosine-synthesizing protein 2 homolog isoform X1 [Clavelina lepadiformis]|uniref:tRNA wybutosine-synthesizing protein 2 homolog isoform X1 n=1 Tax=Clavelina lepadiformis TaxID=159417 RepID=UPI004042FB61